LDQLLLDHFIELHLLRSLGLGPTIKGSPDAFGYKQLADSSDRREADVEALDDLLVGPIPPGRPFIG
jgi:hypothetical protein